MKTGLKVIHSDGRVVINNETRVLTLYSEHTLAAGTGVINLIVPGIVDDFNWILSFVGNLVTFTVTADNIACNRLTGFSGGILYVYRG